MRFILQCHLNTVRNMTWSRRLFLRHNELVPEAYRQNFRNYNKIDKQTYIEFAHEKETLLRQMVCIQRDSQGL